MTNSHNYIHLTGKQSQKKINRRLIVAFYVILFVLSIGLGMGGWYSFRINDSLPNPQEMRELTPSLVSRVKSTDGAIVYDFSVERRLWISLDSIPSQLINAVIAIEDRRFYQHHGIDIRRIFGALIIDLIKREYAQGASTITQQLARNIYLSLKPSINRKIREVFTAFKLESCYSKREIMELYLNQIYFGAGVYGAEAASQQYFSKSANVLDLNECATLAGIIQLPEYYRPDRKNNLKRITNRRNAVLKAMLEMRFIDVRTYKAQYALPVPSQPQSNSAPRAPYFVEMVRQYIEKKYGEDKLYNGGLTIYTTLDATAQDSADAAINDQLKSLQKRMNTYFLDRSRLHNKLNIPRQFFYDHFDSLHEVYRADFDALPDSLKLRTVQTAVVALDVETGGIAVLSGGRNFTESKFNRAIQAIRQPGSSFKPIVYTAALENGLNPLSVILDQPVTIMTPEGEWRPQNYDGVFMGPIPLRRALEKSINLVAIQVLLKIGAPTVVDYARRMGLTHQINAIPSLAVGSCEVVPLELINAYTVFPSGGYLSKPYFITKIVDRNGTVLEQNYPQRHQVLAAKTAFIMCDMLSGVVRRGTAASIPGLGFTRPAAGKTGTSNDFSDAWFIGFTPQLVCGIWIGVDERRSLGYGITGAEAAIPIWVRSMLTLHRNLPVKNFTKPDSVVSISICTISSKVATAACPQISDNYFIEGSIPNGCDIHGAAKESSNSVTNPFGNTKAKTTPHTTKRPLMF